MKKLFFLFCVLSSLIACGQNGEYKIVKTYHISSMGGWDYIAVNDGRIYVSHGS